MTEYEDIEGGGSYAKFDAIGDKVEGTVVSSTLDGGRDFQQRPCPEISVNTADGIVKVTCSPANLRAKAEAGIANGKIVSGAPILVEFKNTYPTDKGQPGKEFRLALGAVPAPALSEI